MMGDFVTFFFHIGQVSGITRLGKNREMRIAGGEPMARDLSRGPATAESSGAESREHVRVSLHTPGFIRGVDESDWRPCTVVNVSNGGIQVAFTGQAPSPDLQSQRFIVKFRIGAEYILEASNVWSGVFEKQFKAGFEWSHPDDLQLDRLRIELMRVAVQRRRRRHGSSG